MKHLEFWFDPVSPFAYLAFERLPQALAGSSHAVTYRPVLFAALLGHFGQKGPAEIEPKRAWTFRQVHWLAHAQGIEIETPAAHPFNPLGLLRLLVASAPAGSSPSRLACERVVRHAWRGGASADAPERLASLRHEMAPPRDPADPAVKEALRASTDEAIARGIFGVPTIVVDGRMFWGADALPMVAACLAGDPWFDGPTWDREGAPRGGVRR